jgi:hypothetical protein
MERMEKQLTAVEWLVDRILHSEFEKDEEWKSIFDRAKEMEKEIIRTAYLDGMDGEYNTSEQYYNTTFKSE